MSKIANVLILIIYWSVIYRVHKHGLNMKIFYSYGFYKTAIKNPPQPVMAAGDFYKLKTTVKLQESLRHRPNH